MNNNNIFDRLSSFSTILIMVVMMIVGAAMIPKLTIQYSPTVKQNSLSIYYSWDGASARVIEQEVTSRLEGVIASVSAVKDISSSSYMGSGSIWVSLKKGANIDNVRFEISSAIRRIYSKLPEGVSYPSINLSTSGSYVSPVLVYTVNGNESPQEIKNYIENNVLYQISSVDGVNNVNLSGANSNYIEVMFDSEALKIYGILPNDIAIAIGATTDHNIGVGEITTDDKTLYAAISSSASKDIGSIIVKSIDGRNIRLSDIASISVKEEIPTSYSRINGLNTINIYVYPEKGVNTIKLVDKLKVRMKQIQADLPSKYGILLVDDSSDYIKGELNKIYLRTACALLILLLFTFLMTRNIKYLLVIFISICANLLIAFIFYRMFNIELHLYSMAGITVSLGILIDTSIIMIDHYGYYHNRKAFLAILAALLTTIGALTVILFLPNDQRANLNEFALVIIINLTVSMFTALLFIPALMDKINLKSKKKRNGIKRQREIVKFTKAYGSFIALGKSFRWIFIVAAILVFGLPVYLIPAKIETKDKEATFWQNLYNKSFGSNLYQQDLKPIVDIALGGTLRLFNNSTKGSGYNRGNPERTRLYINAGLPEGCTVQQLNEVIVDMENFLNQFEQIDIYRTNVSSYSHAQIEVMFKKEYENSGFAYYLKSAAISEAINLGGANWSIYGVGNDGFNNNISVGYKPYQIAITGYNYDQLYGYALELADSLRLIKRVDNPEVYGKVSWGNNLSKNEMFVDFNAENLSLYGISPYTLYSTLSEQMYSRNIGQYYQENVPVNIKLISDKASEFDVWQLSNSYFYANDETQIMFPNLAKIEKRRTGNDIYRWNQQYRLYVAYDFTGPYVMADRVTNRQIEQLNKKLPIGYKAYREESSWWGDDNNFSNFRLLVLIAVIIYFVCAILFESLLQPLVIISLIPISFIGVFLIFYITGFNFDQGGFASLVLLSGLVVNAGIYIINEYNNLIRISDKRGLPLYLKAYNHKITPILLTILSTILGVIPFLFSGKSEVFWFSFAIGTIGGMLFSIVALIIYLPLLLRFKY